MRAVAYINWGRIVADCPNPDCTNALALDPGQSEFRCLQGCGMVAQVEWPEDIGAIEASLADLPESQQQWRPEPADE